MSEKKEKGTRIVANLWDVCPCHKVLGLAKQEYPIARAA